MQESVPWMTNSVKTSAISNWSSCLFPFLLRMCRLSDPNLWLSSKVVDWIYIHQPIFESNVHITYSRPGLRWWNRCFFRKFPFTIILLLQRIRRIEPFCLKYEIKKNRKRNDRIVWMLRMYVVNVGVTKIRVLRLIFC